MAYPSHSSVRPSTSFIALKVNPSTFVLVEDDRFGERPYIYIKIYPNRLLITDTGCNAPKDKKISLTLLRKFMEDYPLPVNNSRCLNPGGKKGYIIVCSHCHYDHILGIPQFLSAKPDIVASAFDKAFITEDLPTNSLCKYVGEETPIYSVTYWARHASFLSLGGRAFRAQLLQIPGHTPDSLAWYDLDEHYLFVGDMFYERTFRFGSAEPAHLQESERLSMQGAILFPEEGGNWIQYMSSLEMILSFTIHMNNELKNHRDNQDPSPRVKVACGHITFGQDAEIMIQDVLTLFRKIIAQKVPPVFSWMKRRVLFSFWLEDDDSRFSVAAPRHLAVEAMEHFHTDKLASCQDRVLPYP